MHMYTNSNVHYFFLDYQFQKEKRTKKKLKMDRGDVSKHLPWKLEFDLCNVHKKHKKLEAMVNICNLSTPKAQKEGEV